MSLEPNIVTIIFEIINFLIVAYVLNRFVFQPLMERARERAAEKRTLLEEIQQEKDALAVLRVELQARLEGAETEAATIVREARERAEEERQALLDAVQVEVERILEEAHSDAARLRRQSAADFHDDLLKTILDVSGLIIGQVTPQEVHETMVEELNSRVWEMGRSEMTRVTALRRALGDRTPAVVVRTARQLSPIQQGKLVRTFTALADRNVNLDIELAEELGVGVRVRVGDLVLDNSIAGKLDALRDTVSDALREQVTYDDE